MYKIGGVTLNTKCSTGEDQVVQIYLVSNMIRTEEQEAEVAWIKYTF